MPMLVKTPVYRLWKNKLARSLKKRRLRIMLDKTGTSRLPGKIRVLEIGCANGMDAIQFMADASRYDIYGVDLNDSRIEMENFTFRQCDAAELPFPDGYFDLVITIGLLEHIEPMEKLCAVASEIRRVGKAYANVMPSISTWLEPHTVSLLWPRFLHKKMVEKRSANQILRLNFFSDHTWTKLTGFAEADVCRFWYFAPFVRNTLVYKPVDER